MSELNAPCKFCGYFGRGYWQSGTHLKKCPFYSIGGEEARLEYLHNPYTTPEQKDARIATLEQSIISAAQRVGCVNAAEMADKIEGLEAEVAKQKESVRGQAMLNLAHMKKYDEHLLRIARMEAENSRLRADLARERDLSDYTEAEFSRFRIASDSKQKELEAELAAMKDDLQYILTVVRHVIDTCYEHIPLKDRDQETLGNYDMSTMEIRDKHWNKTPPESETP